MKAAQPYRQKLIWRWSFCGSVPVVKSMGVVELVYAGGIYEKETSQGRQFGRDGEEIGGRGFWRAAVEVANRLSAEDKV